jgi:hypothetical protein
MALSEVSFQPITLTGYHVNDITTLLETEEKFDDVPVKVLIRVFDYRCGDDKESVDFQIQLFNKDEEYIDNAPIDEKYEWNLDDFMEYQENDDVDEEDYVGPTFSVNYTIFDTIRNLLMGTTFNEYACYEWDIVVCVHYNRHRNGYMFPFCETMTRSASFYDMSVLEIGYEFGDLERNLILREIRADIILVAMSAVKIRLDGCS